MKAYNTNTRPNMHNYGIIVPKPSPSGSSAYLTLVLARGGGTENEGRRQEVGAFRGNLEREAYAGNGVRVASGTAGNRCGQCAGMRDKYLLIKFRQRKLVVAELWSVKHAVQQQPMYRACHKSLLMAA
jgi:hypothetical protein